MKSNEKLKTQMYGLIESWKRSGLNQKEFCNAEGINYYKFKYWKTRQNQEQQLSPKKQIEPKPDFVPVTAPRFENMIPGVEITFPNGVKPGFSQGLGAHQIKELIKLF